MNNVVKAHIMMQWAFWDLDGIEKIWCLSLNPIPYEYKKSFLDPVK